MLGPDAVVGFIVVYLLDFFNPLMHLYILLSFCSEVIKLEYSLRLKIKRNHWLLESENELKFYNLKAFSLFSLLFISRFCMY